MHPNKIPFYGVVAFLGTQSNKMLAGSRGRRIILHEDVAKNAISTLLETGVSYSSLFDKHDVQKKIGVVTWVGIIEKELCIAGHLFGKDFPEVLDVITTNSSSVTSTSLGLSFEATDVCLANASARIWEITKLTFTGVAVIRRDKAAYSNTWIELDK